MKLISLLILLTLLACTNHKAQNTNSEPQDSTTISSESTNDSQLSTLNFQLSKEILLGKFNPATDSNFVHGIQQIDVLPPRNLPSLSRHARLSTSRRHHPHHRIRHPQLRPPKTDMGPQMAKHPWQRLNQNPLHHALLLYARHIASPLGHRPRLHLRRTRRLDPRRRPPHLQLALCQCPQIRCQ